MGILDTLPEDGSAMSVADLAFQLKINPELVGMYTHLIP